MRGEGLSINIYGDSLMKGTVIDENYRYHTVMADNIREFSELFGARVENKARFGITVAKGKHILEQDLERGESPDYALIEFGGNDCNFKWNEVSERPEAEHEPLTLLPRFRETIGGMIAALKGAAITPILMTLPPIDAEKYLRFIGRGGNDSGRILRWLGDTQMIYRFHELYSHTVAELAHRGNILLIDARKYFLERCSYHRLIGLDGIHLNQEGYKLLYEAIRDFALTLRGGRLTALPVPV